MYYTDFDFTSLSVIRSLGKSGSKKGSYNNCWISADTETSKKPNSTDNHVCAFSMACRYNHKNIMCIYGNKPTELVFCFQKIREVLTGHDIYIYFHNLAYDWIFLRRFLIDTFGEPVKLLATKFHNPIYIEFSNGIILRDSLILSACKLEKWANDLDIEHKKAVGFWNYDKLRNQNEVFSEEELLYIYNDVLALVECLDKTAKLLNKSPFSMPYTNTGIVRNDCKEIGKKHNAHKYFLRIAPTLEQFDKLMKLFHGGFTHGNRYHYGEIIKGIDTICEDFTSSYPFSALVYRYPQTRFTEVSDMSISDILELSNRYAFMFKLILIKPELKNYQKTVMPMLQLSKCEKVINPVIDNGRILSADYVEIYLNEIDLTVYSWQYTQDSHICTEVEMSIKDYLPRWLTDYIFSLFEAKSRLKGKDPINYGIAKSKINSVYGMMATKSIKPDIVEIYGTGEYETIENFNQENYDKYLNRLSSIFAYQWGVWITSYSFMNLHLFGNTCIDYDNGGEWLYSDTDSIFATKWNWQKVEAYNNHCKELLKKNGYGPIMINNKEYCLGVAETDKKCTEFCYLGAKRYAYRDSKDNELKITVAGVPKAGKIALNNDINNFKKGFIFPGTVSGKLQVQYNFVDNVYTDMQGNITGDSIDLTPCDYVLDSETKEHYKQESFMLDYIYD